MIALIQKDLTLLTIAMDTPLPPNAVLVIVFNIQIKQNQKENSHQHTGSCKISIYPCSKSFRYPWWKNNHLDLSLQRDRLLIKDIYLYCTLFIKSKHIKLHNLAVVPSRMITLSERSFLISKLDIRNSHQFVLPRGLVV